MPRYIDVNSALQAHPEFLNEQIDDRDKAIYAKGWNACNSAYYDAIKEIDSVSPDEVRGVGKWETKHNRVAWWYECSCCHERPLISRFGDTEILSTYCPNCGAKMEPPKEEAE